MAWRSLVSFPSFFALSHVRFVNQSSCLSFGATVGFTIFQVFTLASFQILLLFGLTIGKQVIESTDSFGKIFAACVAWAVLALTSAAVIWGQGWRQYRWRGLIKPWSQWNEVKIGVCFAFAQICAASGFGTSILPSVRPISSTANVCRFYCPRL